VEAYISRWLVEEAMGFMKQSCNLEDIRMLDPQRLKNMMGILWVALYLLSVHLGQYAARIRTGLTQAEMGERRNSLASIDHILNNR